jgi:hypothetical protein
MMVETGTSPGRLEENKHPTRKDGKQYTPVLPGDDHMRGQCHVRRENCQQRGREMGFPDFLVKKSGNVHFFEHDAVRN